MPKHLGVILFCLEAHRPDTVPNKLDDSVPSGLHNTGMSYGPILLK
ncbi:MAG: hypothetical protein ACYS21_02860 [Planctomycetota bacterium]